MFDPIGSIGALLGGAAGRWLGGRLPSTFGGPDEMGSVGKSIGGALPASMGLGPSQGEYLGKETKAFNKAAYPGTLPWEQLGAKSAPAAAARVQTSSQERMQNKQIRSNEKIARIQANASVAASGQAGVPYGYPGEGDYKMITTMARERLGSIIKQFNSQSQANIADAVSKYALARVNNQVEKMRAAEAEIADLLAKSQLYKPAWHIQKPNNDDPVKITRKQHDALAKRILDAAKKLGDMLPRNNSVPRLGPGPTTP